MREGTTRFGLLLREGEQPVIRLITRMIGVNEADDLVQETFVRAYMALDRGNHPLSPIAWLLGIARNVVLEALRKRRYEREMQVRMTQVMGAEWQNPWQQEWVERLSSRLVVAEAIEALPSILREPVVLHYFAGLSVEEVALQLGLRAGAAKTRLWRARNALRSELEGLDTTKEETVSTRERVKATPTATAVAYNNMHATLHVAGSHYPVLTSSYRCFESDGMSIDTMTFAVERLNAIRVAGDRPLARRMSVYTASDPFEHAQPAAVWKLALDSEVGNDGFRTHAEAHLIPTDGWRIGTDPEWSKVLADMKAGGLHHVWFTFFGLGSTHDEIFGRAGAFDAAITAIGRCREAGLEPGAQIVASKTNASEVEELSDVLAAETGQRPIAYVNAWSLEKNYEAIRPTPEDLALVRDVEGNAAFWSDLESHTERALTEAALESSGSGLADPTELGLPIYIDGNMDLFIGTPGWGALQLIGNLKKEDASLLHDDLVGTSWPPPVPSDAELASRFGDAESSALYMKLGSLRRKWVDAWRRELNLPWIGIAWFIA